MSGAAPAVTLRSARREDRDFLERLYASTRTQELEQVPFSDEQKTAFLAQQFAAQSAHYARHYADASFLVVLLGADPIGRLIVDRRADELRIIDVALLPAHRGRGIGTQLMRPLLDEADAAGVPVSIHVERFNPALRWYARLGFTVRSDEDGVYLLLERAPRAVHAKTAS